VQGEGFDFTANQNIDSLSKPLTGLKAANVRIGHCRSNHLLMDQIKTPAFSRSINLVQGEGFEPPKAEPADLQSAVFDRFTIPAYVWSHLSDSNRRPSVYKTDALAN
jgi:hypothetical protein